MSAGKLDNILNESEEGILSININNTISYKYITIGNTTQIVHLQTAESTISSFNIDNIGNFAINYEEILLKNLINRFKDTINANQLVVRVKINVKKFT